MAQQGQLVQWNDERGFGFITGDDGQDVYVHSSSIQGGVTLAPGDVVEYDSESGERGLRAKNVKKV